MRIFLSLLLFLVHSLSFSQSGIGKWREHLPYSRGVSVCIAESRIFCVAEPSVYYYDYTDYSVEKLSKVNGLSDIGATVVKYSSDYKTLIIGYSTGNIDLIVGSEIINISDIKRSLLQSDKTINEILIEGKYAYISTGFGVILFDIERREIKDTYIVGAGGSYVPVNEATILNDTLFTATNDGIYFGSLNKNLADFQNWTKVSGLPTGRYNTICAFHDKVYTNFRNEGQWDKDTAFVYSSGQWNKVFLGTAYNYGNLLDYNLSTDGDLLISYEYGLDILDSNLTMLEHVYTYGGSYYSPNVRETVGGDGVYWCADLGHGLMNKQGGTFQNYKPTGPAFANAWGMDYSNGRLWLATGSLTPNYKNNYNDKGIATFYNNEWTSYYGGATYDTLRDIHAIITNPDNENHIFAASWAGGLYEFKDGQKVKIHNETNSAIQSIALFPWRGIGGLAFDSKKQLWMTNSGLIGQSITNPLLTYDLNGTWHAYSLNNILTNSPLISKIIVDKRGYKWMSAYLKGIIVFDENGTLDDESDDVQVLLSTGETSGNLPNNEIHAMAEDADGKIWIGGSAGLAVFNTPEKVFESGSTNAERFIIQEDTVASYLLSDEIITVIKINAANQKWIGTQGSGVFLMSADMQQEIHHFNTENSPLLSDIIYDIEIDDQTGEVYFSTNSGLISFMGSATDSEKYDGPAYAFPNPVPPGFNGTIGIRGLPNNSEVKITDISGNLIFETIAEGGTATWDGKSLNGKKAQSGVYIVFASNSDGSKKEVTKILFLN